MGQMSRARPFTIVILNAVKDPSPNVASGSFTCGLKMTGTKGRFR
jgi:hypothetical protein